ncbi:hypothetical protein GCM10027039_08130 [Terrabacter koreensis]
MAYIWAAIIGGVIVSSMLSQASGDQPVLVGGLGAIAGMFVLMVVRAVRTSPAPSDHRSGSPVRPPQASTEPSLDARTFRAATSPQSSGERDMLALKELADRLAHLYPGWDARITQFDRSLHAVQIDHFPGLSTVLFTLVNEEWSVLPLLLDSSGEPIPGGPQPHPLGTRRDQLDETVVRIIRAEVDAYRRTAHPDSSPHASLDISQAMRQRATEALRFLTPSG